MQSNMPYDSNTIKHEDNKECFFFGFETVKPKMDKNQLKFLKNKKRIVHTNNNNGLSSYQLKKQQAFEKKKNILFLKRLENDGAPVRMHQNEKDLLRLYSNQEEDEAFNELDTAIVNDLYGSTLDKGRNMEKF